MEVHNSMFGCGDRRMYAAVKRFIFFYRRVFIVLLALYVGLIYYIYGNNSSSNTTPANYRQHSAHSNVDVTFEEANAKRRKDKEELKNYTMKNKLREKLNFIYKNNSISFSFHSTRYRNKMLHVADILTGTKNFSLAERLTLRDSVKRQSLILFWDTSFDQKNFRACPDWNCKATNNRRLLTQADAVILSDRYNIQQEVGQYFIFYSQESPINSPSLLGANFNMTLGYRLDSPASSPYGFTVRLAEESVRTWDEVLKEIQPTILTKSKPVAWFVSHCYTNSGRETIVETLQSQIQIDVYGICGPLNCAKGGACQEMLNSDYFFYYAAENSICTNYITEKLWAHCLNRTIVPIVLRRKLVEGIVPPHSFIAVDDFEDAVQMARHLKRLMANQTLYLKYFKWKMEYDTVMLDGETDALAERPWGFCQICRLTQLKQRPSLHIPSITKYWTESCEKKSKLAADFSRKTADALKKSGRIWNITKPDSTFRQQIQADNKMLNIKQTPWRPSMKSLWKLTY